MTYSGRHDLPTRQPPGYPPPLHQVPRYNNMKNGIHASGRYGVSQHRYESKQQKTADRCEEWRHTIPDSESEDPNEMYPNPFRGYPRQGADPPRDSRLRDAYTPSHRERRPPSTEGYRRPAYTSEARIPTEVPSEHRPRLDRTRVHNEFETRAASEENFYGRTRDRSRHGYFDHSNDNERRIGERNVRDDLQGVRYIQTGDPGVGAKFSRDKERPRGRGGYEHRERVHFESDDDEYAVRRPSRHMRPGSHNAASHLPPALEHGDLGKGRDSARFDRATYNMRSDSRDAERPRTRTPDFDGDESGRRSDAFGRAPVGMRPETRYTERPRSREAGGIRFGGTRESSRVGMPPSAMRSSSHVAPDSRAREPEGNRHFQRSRDSGGADVSSGIPVPGSRYAARHEVRGHAPQYNTADSGFDEPLDTDRFGNRGRETVLPEKRLPDDFGERLNIHDTRGTGRSSSYNAGISHPDKLNSEPGDIRGVSSHSRDPLHFLQPEREYPGRGLSGRDDPDAKAMVVHRGGNPREPDQERLKIGRDSRRQDPDRTFVPYRAGSRGREGSRYNDYGRNNSSDRGRLERRGRSSSGRRTSSRDRGTSRHARESKGRSKDKKDKKDKRGKKEIMIMRKPNKAQLFLVRSLH